MFWVTIVLGFAFAQEPASIATKTAKLAKQDGYFPFYWDERAGKILVEIPRMQEEFLYVNSLSAGLGSNDIGLDRGQLGRSRIVRFERSGPKVMLVQPNYDFRAISDDANEVRAVRESFAESVLWGFTVVAEEHDKVLVDATDFFLRDAHGVADRLQSSRQGSFRLEPSRSALYSPRTKNFPKNTEVEATLTFAGRPEGRYVREVAPSPDALTVRMHHSFVELPGPGYEPRAFDPRAGYFGMEYFDFATPVSEPIRKQFLSRHRLQKKDRSAAVSEAVKPIVYYLDRGVPEPIRSALLEGARWWQDAFTEAGFRNAYRVELLPEGADAMDLRYNVIQWVHRATRGWSYGATVRDPRTGEIIKGHVTLGSLRVRQDYLIAEGLLAPYETGKPASKEMQEMALARLRQLAAHEVGHTLGLGHNYVSSVADRASVMDYPHPLVELDVNGNPTLRNAYSRGAGKWDRVAIAYGYSDFGSEAAAAPHLRKILSDAYKRGVYFLTDEDARPAGSAHPQTHLWDNGSNAAAELQRVMQVREKALGRFGENNIREGRPFSTLEEPLVTTYLMHRYQAEATAKVIGGLYYTNALRGDGQLITAIATPAEQRKALAVLLATLTPRALTIPESVLRLLPPAANEFPRTREYFASRTGLTFDPLSAAESAAGVTLALILHPERAGRLIQYNARDARNPGLAEVIDRVIGATWKRTPTPGLEGEVGRTVGNAALHQLMALSLDARASAQVRAIAIQKLEQLRTYAATQKTNPDSSQRAHFRYAEMQIRKLLEDPKPANLPRLPEPPPGMPIGCAN